MLMGIENTAADIVDDETLFSLNSLREKNYEDYVNNAEIPEDDSEDDLEMEPDMELEEEDKDRYLEEISKELEEKYRIKIIIATTYTLNFIKTERHMIK